MIGDVKMQTIKRRTGRSLTGDRPLFLALCYTYNIWFLITYCWKGYINTVFNTIRRIIFIKICIYNHQKSQVESLKLEAVQPSQLQRVIERVIDDTYRHHKTTQELFPAPLKL